MFLVIQKKGNKKPGITGFFNIALYYINLGSIIFYEPFLDSVSLGLAFFL